MEVYCLVHRNDEDEMQGIVFTSVREAIDNLKQRALEEGKQWSDYIIKPIENAV
jgi:hypothetical protein